MEQQEFRQERGGLSVASNGHERGPRQPHVVPYGQVWKQGRPFPGGAPDLPSPTMEGGISGRYA